MSIRKSRVCVVGAGVIGLSTAINILDLIGDVTVTIVAEHVTPDTTSDGAGGFWEPYLCGKTPLDKVRQWGIETFEHLMSVSRTEQSPEAGVFLVSGSWISQQEIQEPFWKDDVLGFRGMSRKELDVYPGYRFGYHYTTIMNEGQTYVPYLMKRYLQKGGLIIRRKVHSFEELANDYDVIVNCSGMGSKDLCDDVTMTPTKGQLIRVRAPWIKNFLLVDDEDLYLLINTDSVILGGTKEQGVTNTDINRSERQRIWKGFCRLIPSLKKSEYMKDWAGLRPTREEVRLEVETIHVHYDGDRNVRKVVHNYGHGGAGLTLHWGCAKEAARLVDHILNHKTAAAKL